MREKTLLIKGIGAKSNPHNAVVPPIFLSSTFALSGIEEEARFAYSRGHNPTRDAFEELFAKFENAKFAYALSSGMAASAAVFGLLKSGNRVILNNNVYGGTYRFVSGIFADRGIKYNLVDDLSKAEFPADTAMVFIETPSNPLLRITDIEKIARKAHTVGALVVVDNTFLTPYFQKPLALGADIVVYSATKFIGGHADLIAGIVACNDEILASKLYFLKNTLGATLSPSDAYALIRGLKTLSVRFDAQVKNTEKIVEFLLSNPAVKAVNFAGSFSENEKKINERQAKGSLGAVISFELKDSYDYKIFAKSLEIFDLAVSLGGVESLICHPASMTHESFPKELQEKIGIKQNLLRIAVGIEDSDDLIDDLNQAIKRAKI